MRLNISSIAYITILVLLYLLLNENVRAQAGITVHRGWNIIGANSTFYSDLMTCSPGDSLTSKFFGYTETGYHTQDTLQQGQGYWIKVSADGMMYPPVHNECGQVVMYGGRGYNTIRIGTQCWFQQNLDIGTMTDSLQDASNNGVIEKYCYGNDPVNCATYGGYYQWQEAMQYDTTSGTQGICPDGWHIPTSAEFQTLRATLGNEGNGLKAVGQGTGDGAGTNGTGFSALLSGVRTLNFFFAIGSQTYFWSSTQYDGTSATDMSLANTGNYISTEYNNNLLGLSIRCLED